MAGVFGISAVAAWLSTTGVGLGQSPREKVIREGKTTEKLEFALAEASGLGAFGISVYLAAIMLQE
jgi:hypothetical protein